MLNLIQNKRLKTTARQEIKKIVLSSVGHLFRQLTVRSFDYALSFVSVSVSLAMFGNCNWELGLGGLGKFSRAKKNAVKKKTLKL
jgi:hypothetical protein